MRFTKEIVLNQPIERVRVLTSDPAHVHEWQPDLVSITQHSDTPGAAGSTAASGGSSNASTNGST